jgi:hypothetical protein
LKANDQGGKVLFQGAADWIFEEGVDWDFSFENVCMRLGLHPSSLRESLRRWRDNTLREAECMEVFTTEEKEKEGREATAKRTALSMRGDL